MRYQNILERLQATPWLITQEGLDVILDIVDNRLQGVRLNDEDLAAFRRSNAPDEMQLPDTPSLAILPIEGSIFPKANLLTAMSGATSIQKLKSDFNTLMDAENVTGILLNIDSPGGSADMIKEMADVIWEARQSGKKPIYAVANTLACSAAYYLGSQAEKLYVTPSGRVGSIGVIAIHTDQSAKDAKDGLKRTVLTVGEHKADGNPYAALPQDVVNRKLEQMRDTYDQFVSDVARGRGVTAEEVEEKFGKGSTFHAKSALERGMVNGIETLESVCGIMQNGGKVRNSRVIDRPPTQGVRKMEGITPETLEALGLSEDATDEEINARVIELATAPPPTPTPVPALDEAAKAFAEQFPEQAREIAELRAGRRQDAAKLFATGYERFGDTESGMSGLALTQIEDLHLKISDGLVTHEDLKTFLDGLASGTAVVDYSEQGSSRGKEPKDINALEAGNKIYELAQAKSVETGKSYGDALAEVLADDENAELVAAYEASRPKPEGGES